MRRFLALTVLVGCDALFPLTAPDAPPGDAPDAAIDALPQLCTSGHDEDGDFLFDACDDCPTVVNTNKQDSDDDGIGDGCDKFPGTKDTVAFYQPLIDETGITISGQAMLDASDPQGSVLLTGAGAATVTILNTIPAAKAYVIQLSVLSSSMSDKFTIMLANGATCVVSATGCGGPTCLTVNGTGIGSQQIAFSNITEITLLVANGQLSCTIGDQPVTAAGTFGQGNILFESTGSPPARVRVRNLVVYN